MSGLAAKRAAALWRRAWTIGDAQHLSAAWLWSRAPAAGGDGAGPSASGCRSVSGVSAPSPSQLSQVMRLEELLKRSREEVEHIWMEYHSDPKGDRVATVMSADEYATFTARAKESPLFVLPLVRPAGYETMLLQCQTPFVLITGLEEFKKHGVSAPPHLTLTHYPELRDSHGVVLVRGDVIHTKGLSLQEARAAMELTRAFYVSDDDYALVHAFNHKPSEFDFAALLRKLGLQAPV